MLFTSNTATKTESSAPRAWFRSTERRRLAFQSRTDRFLPGEAIQGPDVRYGRTRSHGIVKIGR